MYKSLIVAVSLIIFAAGIAQAQVIPGNQFTAGNGVTGYQNGPTSEAVWTDANLQTPFFYTPPSNTTTNYTQNQATAMLPTNSSVPFPGSGGYAPGNLAGKWWGGPLLPVTNLDSFVNQSGMDFDIYGDEGVFGPPPLMGFEFNNTIEQGIEDSRDNSTLTTGHAGALPSAWLWTTAP
jgi:hypothetical protein